MTVTRITPLAARLNRDLDAIEEALAVTRDAAEVAGPDAIAIARVTIYVGSQEEVDAVADWWGISARWDDACRYAVRRELGPAETEAVWVRPKAQAVA